MKGGSLVARRLNALTRQRPHDLAYTVGRQAVSYYDLNAAIESLVDAMSSAGLCEGDRIALVSNNRLEFVPAMLAADRSGISIVPLSPTLTAPELQYIMRNAGVVGCIVDAACYETGIAALADIVMPMKFRLALGGILSGFSGYDDALRTAVATQAWARGPGQPIYYTSGTTGRPKGVIRPRPDLGPLARHLPGLYAFKPGDVFLYPIPMSNLGMFGIGIRIPLAAGIPVHVLQQTDPISVIAAIAERRTTHAYLTPHLLHRLRACQEEWLGTYDLSSLRFILHAGAPCAVDLKHWAIDVFGPILHEFYAGTEGGGVFISSEEWLKKPGSVGKPLPDYPVRVYGAAGELLPANMPGDIYLHAEPEARFEYLHDPDKTAAAYRGEFFTLGDIGYLDSDGYLFLTGRSAEICVVGGFNVYPEEIDQCLTRHPDVADAISFSIPEPGVGENVVSLVVPRVHARSAPQLVEVLRQHCQSELAPYKHPAVIVLVDEVPRSDIGKRQREIARRRYLEGR